MKLLEYQAKEIFRRAGIRTMPGAVIREPAEALETIRAAGLRYPVVLKGQVPVGGRGKAGGVQFAETEADVPSWAERLSALEVRGCRPQALLAEEKAEAAQELYLSILLDRQERAPLLVFSPDGGMDIEQTVREHPERAARVPLDPVRGPEAYTIEYLISRTGADHRLKPALLEVSRRLFAAFYDWNAMLLEINPLMLTASGELIAADGKAELDDNALSIGKLPDAAAWREASAEDPRVKEARRFGFHFVPLDPKGTVAIMSNGSGMMMSCLDLVTKRGMRVGCCLDQGGGATRERLKEAIRILFSDAGIRVLLVYIFGGITRCDEVAAGIRDALTLLPTECRVVVRIEGTRKEEAMQILRTLEDRVTAVSNVPEAVEALAALHREAEQ